ncbi:ABC transporter ATP-binding protein [Paenibacillus monticola]|uniref:ATP-binding cassette domain-containing protein n=1 Tax=Paenibacillus monticola TaxID=2666075 RepID=A0A7X2H3E8_9BACL|nr:ATP-binding cassette domain-containing protein [Paenibacillus monticola]
MGEIVVNVAGVSKVIRKQTLVEDISFQIPKGSVLALCGGNGAGKSTVLRMIAGILQPTSGTVTVNNLRWSKERKLFSQQIGYMPDDYQFNQGLSAEETLMFWAALRKVPKRKTRVEEVLELVGLAEKRKSLVNTFSKGMRQRILYAQALLAKPPLLIMDEPTNGLDPFWMNEFVERLQNIKQEGHTVIFSTHQLEIADKAADHIVFLSNGRNVGEGSTGQIREQFGSLYAAFNHSLGLK